MPVVEGRISGRTENVRVLRDTGCSGGIIRRSMCSEDSYTGETRTCVMINGATFTAPANETEDTGNYEPCDEKTQKKSKTFHANTVRKYVSREKNGDKRMKDDVVEGLQLVSEDQDSQLGSEDAMFCPLEATESWTDVSIGPQLTDVQQLETRHLLEEYGDVFSDLPGHTDITECTIELVDDTPIRCKNYPVPFAMEQVMKEEVIKMDRMGITEPSTSDYASPSVIVRKQDGSHRYCIDFRRINMVSLTDAEPMPNQEMVIGKLGASGYFTK